MPHRPRWLRLIAVPAALVLLAAGSVLACSVPVWRYALERWPSSPYLVHVFHKGPLTPGETARVRHLAAALGSGTGAAVAEVHGVNLDGDVPPKVRAVWERDGGEALPWVVVRYPMMLDMPRAVWAGPLDAGALATLPGSPARAELARRLLSDSAVFVFLETGRADEDDAAAARLRAILEELERTLELPGPVDGTWGDVLYDEGGAPDLEVAFSILRVGRDDPAEALFVSMLLQTEHDLLDLDQPIAFAVYGRGLALPALVGAGINAEMVGEACAWVVGPCSCVVREENPGIDLLIAADWDAALAAQGEAVPSAGPAPVGGLGEFVATPADEPVAAARPASSLLWNVLLAMGGIVLLVVIAALVLLRRKGAGA